MDDNQLSTMLLYFFGALLLCGAGIMAMGAFVSANKHIGKWLLPLISPLLLVAMTIGTALSKRNITNAELEIATASGTASGALVWLLRLSTMLVLGICLARLISISQHYEFRPRQGRALFVAFLIFMATNAAINNVFGTKPLFDHRFIYPTLVFTAVYMSRNQGYLPMIDFTKWGLLFFCLASAAAVTLFPQTAVQQGYASILPFGVRLWGLGTNPNSTGPLALLLLLLLICRPFSSRLMQWAGYGAGLFVLILSQSKTAWIAAALAFPALWWGKVLYAEANRMRSRKSAYSVNSFMRPILLCLLGLAGIITLAYLYLYNPLDTVSQDEQVTSLTGRTAIWATAIDTWKSSPLFGYGSSMWDENFRQAIGMDYAYHAHNQFLQSLSSAGVIGLAGLVIYLLVLFYYAYAANTATRGLSLAIFLTIFVRFFTETPLDMSSLFSGEFVTHLLLFSIVLTKGKQPHPVVYRRPDYAQLHNLQKR